MSKFTRNFTRTIEFDGDQVSVTMKRLKRKQMFDLAPYMGEADENGKVKMSLKDNMQLLDQAQEKIKANLVALSGLTIDGEELAVEGGKPSNPDLYGLIFDEAYFMNLLGEMLGAMVEESFVGEEDEKKSDGQRGGTSQG